MKRFILIFTNIVLIIFSIIMLFSLLYLHTVPFKPIINFITFISVSILSFYLIKIGCNNLHKILSK
jgi:membrane protein implicated in regulation of membrane protease activity